MLKDIVFHPSQGTIFNKDFVIRQITSKLIELNPNIQRSVIENSKILFICNKLKIYLETEFKLIMFCQFIL